MSERDRPIPSPDVVYREIAGECVLVPLRGELADPSSIYTLNEVGSFVWSRIDGRRTVGAIVVEVVEAFDVSEEAARLDVERFLADLVEVGVVRLEPG